jgi:hypothetical protein
MRLFTRLPMPDLRALLDNAKDPLSLNCGGGSVNLAGVGYLRSQSVVILIR